MHGLGTRLPVKLMDESWPAQKAPADSCESLPVAPARVAHPLAQRARCVAQIGPIVREVVDPGGQTRRHIPLQLDQFLLIIHGRIHISTVIVFVIIDI